MLDQVPIENHQPGTESLSKLEAYQGILGNEVDEVCLAQAPQLDLGSGRRSQRPGLVQE
jgi:hypothetical protein